MSKQLSIYIVTTVLLGVVLVVGAYMLGIVTKFASASAPSGLPATQRIATTTSVGPQEIITIFSDKQSCSSRIISTTDGTGQAIQVLFGDPTNGDIASTSVSATVGHLQSASTTVMYDAGLYGCGRWTVYASATTTILLSEF